jgi:hypothetical protein
MGASGAPIISNRNDQFYTKKLKYPAAKERVGKLFRPRS